MTNYTKSTKPIRDHRQDATELIIKHIEAGTAPWQEPWLPGRAYPSRPMNPVTNKQYRGGNAAYLSIVALCELETKDPRWCTYKQASSKGWQIKKGSKGHPVEYWQWQENREILDTNGKPILDEHGKPKKELVDLPAPRILRSTVFHASMISGIPELPALSVQENNANEIAEKLIKDSGAVILHDQEDAAFYRHTEDKIHVPPINRMISSYDYYSVVLHELGHWTGHETRLNRGLQTADKIAYAKEELRAELASFFLAMDIGIGPTESHVKNHAAYIESWVEALRNDKNEIYRAAKDAEQICQYLTGREQIQEVVPEITLPAIIYPHQIIIASQDRVYGGKIINAQDDKVLQEISPGVAVEHRGLAGALRQDDVGKSFSIDYDSQGSVQIKEVGPSRGNEKGIEL